EGVLGVQFRQEPQIDILPMLLFQVDHSSMDFGVSASIRWAERVQWASKLKMSRWMKIFLFLWVLFILIAIRAPAQDSSKYHGGSYDGFSIGNVPQTGLGGININLAKYFGGSYDGFSIGNISQTGLGGISINAAKHFGGSYDGFAVGNISQTGLGGISINVAKYFGGSYDGFTLGNISQTGLGGQTIDLSKYFGGSYDGFTLGSISQTGLGGQTINPEKFFGGSYDGFTIYTISQTGLGGQTTDLAKYHGGSYDGFVVNTTQLIPLSGNRVTLKLTTLIEGFYNQAANKMISDTVMVYIRISTSAPYTIVDSAKVLLDSLGQVSIDFRNVKTGSYFIVIKHRNSIETWSKSPGTNLVQGSTNIYDFTISQSQGYGNNLVLKGTRYCIYSGDVNQDEVVDGSDLALIDNDASNFTKGYVVTDVNGDQVVDGSDLSLDDNNASNFVSVIKPPGAGDITIQFNKNKNFYQNLNGK